NRTFLIRRITEALETAGEAVPAGEQPAHTDAAETQADTPTEASNEGDDTTATADDVGEDAGDTPLTKMSVPDLQARYREVVGRDTSSSNKRYLVWKIREAQRGRVPVGPRRGRRTDGEAADFKVLPLRMEAEQVERLDEARERLGLKSRMDLFRRALHAYLETAGEADVAALFAPEA
ncbi:MAG: ribbon-helix-helix protein, CopG family, partial [Myxococcales bacterium]|nr:ribbon-helix-helix protein, CopG family [Myxococcales bacterium]